MNEFPKVWNDPKVEARDKKRIVRLVIRDVTLVRHMERGEIHADIRFVGGAIRSLTLSTPIIVYEKWKTRPEILAEIDQLLGDHTEGAVARLLNERGLTTSHGNPFRAENIANLRRQYGMKHRREAPRPRVPPPPGCRRDPRRIDAGGKASGCQGQHRDLRRQRPQRSGVSLFKCCPGTP